MSEHAIDGVDNKFSWEDSVYSLLDLLHKFKLKSSSYEEVWSGQIDDFCDRLKIPKEFK